jgi:hypothetical protein
MVVGVCLDLSARIGPAAGRIRGLASAPAAGRGDCLKNQFVSRKKRGLVAKTPPGMPAADNPQLLLEAYFLNLRM